MNVYPAQFQAPEVLQHIIALLERRRLASDVWDEALESRLIGDATQALADAGRTFRDMADDEPYWRRVTEQVTEVGLPRYLRLAKAQQALEVQGYGVWRRGDAISRATYALAGLVIGAVILRTAIPDWLEPLPIALFVLGPLLPDAQAWFAKRRYANQLNELVDDVRREAVERRVYEALPEPTDAVVTRADDRDRSR